MERRIRSASFLEREKSRRLEEEDDGVSLTRWTQQSAKESRGARLAVEQSTGKGSARPRLAGLGPRARVGRKQGAGSHGLGLRWEDASGLRPRGKQAELLENKGRGNRSSWAYRPKASERRETPLFFFSNFSKPFSKKF